MDELKSLKEKLKAHYGGTIQLTQKDLAIIERQAWELEKLRMKQAGEAMNLQMGRYFMLHMGSPDQANVNVRAHILSLGPWADVLWEKVHANEFSLRVAYDQGVLAKKAAIAKGISPQDAIDEVLAEYYETRTQTRTLNGKVYRTRKPNTRIKDSDLEDFDDKDWDPQPKDSKKFFALLRLLTERFVGTRLSNLEPSVRKDLARDFEYEIRIVYEDLLKKLNNFKRDDNLEKKKKSLFSAVCDACACLGIQAPANATEAVDERKARDAQRRLASRFHPDRNKGDTKMVEQYRAVNEAWSVVQRYNEQLEE